MLWGALFEVLEQIDHYRHFSWDKITILHQREIKAIAVISEFQVVAHFNEEKTFPETLELDSNEANSSQKCVSLGKSCLKFHRNCDNDTMLSFREG